MATFSLAAPASPPFTPPGTAHADDQDDIRNFTPRGIDRARPAGYPAGGPLRPFHAPGRDDVRRAHRAHHAGGRQAPVVQVALRPGCGTDAPLGRLLRPRRGATRDARRRGCGRGGALRRQPARQGRAAHPLLRGPAAVLRRPGRGHAVHHRPQPAPLRRAAAPVPARPGRPRRSGTEPGPRHDGARDGRTGPQVAQRGTGTARRPSARPNWKPASSNCPRKPRSARPPSRRCAMRKAGTARSSRRRTAPSSAPIPKAASPNGTRPPSASSAGAASTPSADRCPT